MEISGLFVYPVKSGAAVAVDSWPLGERGLRHDREYMVVDSDGVFVTQRKVPRLALLSATPGEPLSVRTPAGSATAVPGARRRVRVWEHTGDALDCGDDVAQLLSDLVDFPCRLVRIPADHDRPTEVGGGQVGFADGFPLLLTTESSLADLNARLPRPLPMNRFRPSIVVSGSPAWDEDEWLRLRIGTVHLDVVKPCERCVTTRVDQATGVRGDGEPLRTLATFRKVAGGLLFGQNAVHRTLGQLRVGDAVSVERRSV